MLMLVFLVETPCGLVSGYILCAPSGSEDEDIVRFSEMLAFTYKSTKISSKP
jgi:hypothetical protein